MKLVNAAIAACTLPLVAAAGAQQTETSDEQDREGIPATIHQEEALREIDDGNLFTRLDEDGDGAISRQEAQAEPSLLERWSDYDEDGDRALNREELSAFSASAASSAEGDDLQVARGELTEEGLPTTEHQQQVVGDGIIERLDEDGDSAISQEEAQGDARLMSQWDQLDQNADGNLDSSELSRLEE